MPRLVLRGATVIDADGVRPWTTVVVDERRIAAVHPDAADGTGLGTGEVTRGTEVTVEGSPGDGDRVVDLGGRTVMPAMVSSHFHATYHELGSKPAPFGLEEPPALQAVRAAHHLELLLRCGFTGAVSAGAPFAIDASMKAAIGEGLFPGPRLMAGSRDVSTTGHAGDKSFAWYWDVGARGAINRSDGPAEFRRAVRQEVKEGARDHQDVRHRGPRHGGAGRADGDDQGGDHGGDRGGASARRARCAATSPTARRCTWRSTPGSTSSTMGTGWTTAAIERMVEAETYLVPSQLFPARFAELMGGAGGGLGFSASMTADMEQALEVLPVANAAGVKLLVGDDYGAIGLPHGRYADELEFYVKEAGIPPLDVLRWATRNGFELMGRGHELGSVREGYLADLLVVDGDPLGDIALLQDPGRLLAIMKGGTLVKDELSALERAG